MEPIAPRAPTASCARTARGFSLGEIVVAAFVIGVSALPVLEWMRSGTASLEVSEIEATARSLAADVLEQLTSPPVLSGKIVDRWAQAIAGPDVPFDVFLKGCPSLARGFPEGDLAPILAKHQVTLHVDIQKNFSHPALGGAQGMDRYQVTVAWIDARGRRKEVALAALVARR